MTVSAINQGRRKLINGSRLFDSVCATCSRSRRQQPQLLKNASTRRPASSLASSTAVNPPKKSHGSATELYNSLERLKSTAANYVNTSRLQLGLRSLEVGTKVIRVAVIDLNCRQSMLKLVELLLTAEDLEPSWKDVLEAESKDGRGLLIRYGENVAVSKTQTLLVTVFLPSSILRDYNIEILASSLHTESIVPGKPSVSIDTFRVPTLETPASASGRFSLVTYPVHQAIVCGEGLSGCVQLASLARNPSITTDRSIQLVLNSANTESDGDDFPSLKVIDIGGIEKNRLRNEEQTNITNAPAIDDIVSLTDWIKAGTVVNGSLKVATYTLIESLLDDTLVDIQEQEAEEAKSTSLMVVPQHARKSLTDVLDDWAERGHAELRDQLDIAFTSHTWYKIAWYKLLWRVDDVAMVALDVLQQKWLHEAERRMIWMSGRLAESGLSSSNSTLSVTRGSTQTVAPRGFVASPPAPTFSDLLPQTTAATTVASSALSEPWSSEIALTRAELYMGIPPLQQLAQKLLVQTLTISSTSSVFAGLLYYAYTPATSLYEVGFVAALGIIASLKRLQSKWESAKSDWEASLREQGRIALTQTERSIRYMIEKGGRPEADPKDIKERVRARESVEEALDALQQLR